MGITPEILQRVESAENALAALGYTDFRVRVTRDGYARLELPDGQLEAAVRDRAKIIDALGGGFARVTLDLKGR